MTVLKKEGEIYTRRIVVISCAIIGFLFLEFIFLKFLEVFAWYGIAVNMELETGKKLMAIVCITVLHELAHYFAYWRICGINQDSIFFGFHWRWFVPYCGCRVPTTVRLQRIVLICPIIVTGCISFFFVLFIPAKWTMVVFIYTLVVSSMDVIHYYKLGKFESNCIVTGHPTEFGGNMIFKNMEAARLFFQVDDTGPKEDS